MKVYLAGGAVRDILLGKPIKDRDYLVTDTTRQEFEARFPAAREVGHTFPVYLLERMEFSFPRAETLEEEIKSRDLTVNAMLLDEDGELIAHPQALDDLVNRVLRPAAPDSLTSDPLRVFRAARFWARFPDFTPHPELRAAMSAVAEAGLLETIAPDRVGQETIKALNSPKPGNFLQLLAETRCLSPWFREFQGGMTIPAGPPAYHDTHVIGHTCRIMDRLAGDEIAVWMGLCHDLGKMLSDPKFLPRHHGHDKRGIGPAESLAKRIRLSNAHVTAGIKAAQWHMTAARYEELRPGTRVDLLMDLHLSRTVAPLFALIVADTGVDLLSQAKTDLESILAVSLPPESRNLGSKSGQILRELRAAVLGRSKKR
ncbi:tRNA nucleotidyltransferase [Pseudodesulfovibrio cashew]|uniref:tRNA nucleotidyltransferase n=2 Tax=Pseudodesulfovibrio cashew TaxID=2678688 RepID=A0A6I6JMA2_9BACT|nr:tRNA nucleotidyltransferase [Pseudodesulfovibrio cashew]